jgi:hypothetical protein
VAYLGRLVIDDQIRRKIQAKHHITFDDVVEAIQYPAKAEAEWEDHPDYGRRLVAGGAVATGRRVLCILKPVPLWDPHADTWDIKTARWVDRNE